DRRRLKQILINLVSNAIKYGGKDCLIKLYAQRFEDRLLIRVKDNGLGISNEKTQRLFTPFDRLDAERNMSETKGTGLGLAIAKKLAKTLGGDIAVISKLNEGSVFTVDLPTLPEVP
ncbi:ATP-binding protein, partial [Verrucomicrobia bacterium]|nr:ATP-binding protein [Verrucomicrobiota bacterium]